MRITRYTDYCLRVLMYVAAKSDEQSTIAEIADSYQISKNHLMKVVQELNTKGYIVATRGKNGGLRLNARPEDICIGALVRDTEQDRVLVDCFAGPHACVIAPACQLKQVLAEALEGFFNILDGYTLADMLPGASQPQLLQLMQAQEAVQTSPGPA